MSGPNPNPNHPPQSGGASEGAGGDPSMEDILASIRRILSEEEGQGAQPSPPDDDGVLLQCGHFGKRGRLHLQ